MELSRGCSVHPLSRNGISVALIHDILPAAEIVRRIVAEVEEALRSTTKLLA